MGIFLILGIFSWIVGGKTDRVTFIYIFPRAAINIGFMYVFWAISFMICGCIFSCIMFSCKKFRRHIVYKICLYLILMQIFTYIIYPLFFGAMSPFLSFLAILIAIFFCILAILSSFYYYSLWTVILSLHLFWLIYNGYVCLAFTFIN